MSCRLAGSFWAISILLSLAAFGQDKPVDHGEFDEVAQAYQSADAELNKEYQRALHGLGRPSDVRNLRDAQRKWIAYRDAVCKAEYDLVGGGTNGSTIHVNCLTRLTKQRTADLQAEY